MLVRRSTQTPGAQNVLGAEGAPGPLLMTFEQVVHVPTQQSWEQHSEWSTHGVSSGPQPQTPLAQTCGKMQTLPQLPQFWLSLLGSMQPKSPQTLPAQSKQVPPPQ